MYKPWWISLSSTVRVAQLLVVFLHQRVMVAMQTDGCAIETSGYLALSSAILLR